MSDWQSWRPSTNVVDLRGTNLSQNLINMAAQSAADAPSVKPEDLAAIQAWQQARSPNAGLHPMDWPFHWPVVNSGQPDQPATPLPLGQQMRAVPFADEIGALLGRQK